MQLTQPLDGARIGPGPEGRGLQSVPAFNANWQMDGDGAPVNPDVPANDATCDFHAAISRLLKRRGSVFNCAYICD